MQPVVVQLILALKAPQYPVAMSCAHAVVSLSTLQPSKIINEKSPILQLSPVTDGLNRPNPRPLPRRSSIMTFDDYAQILARPCKRNVKPSVDSVSSDIQLRNDCAPDTSDADDDLLAAESHMDEDDDMVIIDDNDVHDDDGNEDHDVHDDDGNEDHEHGQANENEENEDEDEDFVCAKTSPDDVEGDSDNSAKVTNEEPEDNENNEDLRCAKTSPGDFSPETSRKPTTILMMGLKPLRRIAATSSQAKREGPATSDQVDTYESDGDEDPDHDHDSPSSPPTKRRKTSSAVKTTSANTSQNTTRSTTVRTKRAHTSILHSSDNPTPAGIVFGPTPDNDPSEDEQELTGHLKEGRLCQEGINEAQELGQTTVEEARVIGTKYGKSARSILIEAGLSIKHSRSESDWNAHQHWFMDNNPRKDKESIVDWKERQRKHYHAMGKEDGQWDTIRNYNITGGNTNQSRAKTILSMREDIARRLSAYSRLEGVEAVGCIFDTTQDEAARQASGFVTGSNLTVNLINEHQLDARAILDLVSEGYNISVPQFMGGVGAYEILLSKLNEPPHDCYRRIWPIMVLENTSKFGYRPKAVQWRKLLDYAFQYKFMIKNWPDDVPPIGPEFNPHYLSSQHLKLLVVPFIKRKAHSYYEAELWTEAENLLELEKKKSKGKHQAQDCTVEDIMSELDVTVPEIKFAAWPDDCLKQLKDEVPEMLDIPLVTSTLDVVLRKLVDSARFKLSIPEDMLAVNEARSDAPVPSTQEMLPSVTSTVGRRVRTRMGLLSDDSSESTEAERGLALTERQGFLRRSR
ncbi:uncharacterized protein F5147DRAFT_784806 [Suillus discolor]|uniref:Uncharacterized protein n=1 Tax=Suillus discolor TaxID=1912936 RepID=A0A9P7EQ15_9AGAM|nr:uncharacterized protein F5147DRAFT_784806 [Suillus discolor]KAG2079723.1 hypothetical protein F5147DRAFT_784806 [Suillus discolor]